MKRMQYKISGRVQGVGFRYFTRDEARKLPISGWVRNEPDGSVLVECQGEAEVLQEFEKRLQKGPPSSRVLSVVGHELSPQENEHGFEIRH